MIAKTLSDGTIEDCATALMVSFDRLSLAAKSANDLLRQAGFAGARGDTADDLHLAIALHDHLMHQFLVKVRTAEHTDVYTTAAESSYSAYAAAAARQGDSACGVTVTPTDVALAAAHRALNVSGPLDAALKNPALSVALHSYARKHTRRDLPRTDFKRQAANDRD